MPAVAFVNLGPSLVTSRMLVMATVNGKEREVDADVLVVELKSDTSVLTLRLDDVEAAQKLFKVGKHVTLTISGGK